MFDFLTPGILPFGPQKIPGVNAPVDKNEGEPTSFLGQIGQGIGDFASGVANEGLAGLLDPAGMMDRADARRDLAKKFDVVPNDFMGPRLPNQVTEAEYNKIAHTYSDIRMGRSDLKIDASTSKDPEQYKADMMDDIGDIMQTESGRKLVGTLANNTNGVGPDGKPIHKSTTLHPHLDAKGNIDTTNAAESGDSSPGVGSPFADGRPGAGGDTTIAANPNMDVNGAGGTWRSDVALYHEMVHSLHDTKGTTDSSTVGAGDDVLREARKGSFSGMIHEAMHPNANTAADSAAGLNRYEHQAAGLGLYRDDPMTENAYRRERNAVALSGKGIGGDLLMDQRHGYTGAGAWYMPFYGM